MPFQIQAQLLRRRPGVARADAVRLFATVPDGMPAASDDPPRGTRHWRQSDVRRAIAAAEQAGLTSYRVEIAPDGTIAVIVGTPADTAPYPGSSEGLPRR